MLEISGNCLQIKNWKRNLYAWAGEEPSESANTSFYSESAEEEAEEGGSDKGSILASLTVEDIKVRGILVKRSSRKAFKIVYEKILIR